ncbi:Uncharacterized protein F54F2.9 [Eumeta japonica]|uniref:Uncharacterized protein F54F2.9 n=1 Tax=Eumeta variegata TaxID=151549 RepID=A0A4C1Y2G8_EUMVA|nr:Uncharacterized protein F54F2.9 [Eumeta japonica]
MTSRSPYITTLFPKCVCVRACVCVLVPVYVRACTRAWLKSQLASRWHWLYRRYCACVIPLFAPQSGDSCLLRVSALWHLLFVFTSWYDSTKLARIETSCSKIGRLLGRDESDDKSDDFDNFTECGRTAHDATPSEIKSTFKKLTLKLHPDKNDSPDADVQFRNLVSVHNILKDPGKRENWAAYFEKRYTAEQLLNTKGKRQKKIGFESGLAEVIEKLPKPSIKDTLPFQIPRAIWYTLTAIPYTIIALRRHLKEKKEQEIRQKKWEEEERIRVEKEAAAAAEAKANRGVRRRRFVPPERDCLLDPADEPASGDNDASAVKVKPSPPPVISGGLWTDDDLMELIRLVNKYPGGASDRWEKIAEIMSRSVPEVTHMAAKLKENCYRIPGQESNEPPAVEVPKKVKTRKNEETGSTGTGGNWTQAQQKALEAALARHPKGGAGDRWEKIASNVPGKTKEECMLRCKYLSDLVKKQKQKEEQEANGEAQTDNGPASTLSEGDP